MTSPDAPQVQLLLTRLDLDIIVRVLQSSVGNIALTERLNAMLLALPAAPG